MSHMTLPTVKIKPSHPSQGEFVEINEKDFDAKKHELFEEGEAVAPAAPAATKKVKATADARKFAEDAGFDISTVKGTGRGGVITVEDVQDAIEAAEESAA